MAFYLLQPDGVALSAGAHRRGRAALQGGGAGRPVGGRSGFRVDTAMDILKVNTTAWSLDPCSGFIDPGNSTNQGMYGWAIDHTPTGTPTPPDSTLPRKDIYYLQVNDSSAGDGTSGTPSLTINYLAGTPASNPSAPSLPPRSFLLGTATVPQSGGGSPTVVRNPATFAAAGAPLPVYSEAERDGLDKYDGLIVQRRDLPGCPLDTYDGDASSWAITPTVQAVALPQGTDPGYVVSGVITKTRVGNLTQVVLSGRMTRAVSADASSAIKTIPNVVPSGYRPTGTGIDWATNHLTAGGLIIRHVNAFIASDGTLTITQDSGASYVVSPGEYWTLQASWWM